MRPITVWKWENVFQIMRSRVFCNFGCVLGELGMNSYGCNSGFISVGLLFTDCAIAIYSLLDNGGHAVQYFMTNSKFGSAARHLTIYLTLGNSRMILGIACLNFAS